MKRVIRMKIGAERNREQKPSPPESEIQSWS
jgi:hypothetical protein